MHFLRHDNRLAYVIRSFHPLKPSITWKKMKNGSAETRGREKLQAQSLTVRSDQQSPSSEIPSRSDHWLDGTIDENWLGQFLAVGGNMTAKIDREVTLIRSWRRSNWDRSNRIEIDPDRIIWYTQLGNVGTDSGELVVSSSRISRRKR